MNNLNVSPRCGKLPQFDCLQSKEELSSFLRQKGENHHCLYHYTKLECFDEIKKNNSLRFSLHNEMNDGLESRYIDHAPKGKYNYYIASFTSTGVENMAMWCMYARPADYGVRIRFDARELVKTIRKSLESGEVYERLEDESFRKIQFAPEHETRDKVIVTDVVYGNFIGKSQMKHYYVSYKHQFINYYDNNHDSKNQWIKDLADAYLPGQVKSYLWHYEEEVRIIICLEKNRRSLPSAIFLSLGSFFENKALCSVMKGPCFSGGECQEADSESVYSQYVSKKFRDFYK